MNSPELDIYEVLVAEHERMLHAYVLSFVHDPFLAEDICQEAFVTAFNQLKTLKNKAAFASWLRTIARNQAFAELRKRKIEVPTDPEILLGMEDIFQAVDAGTNPAPWDDRIRAVSECMASLPSRLHDCCRLHYCDGKPVRDVAESLGITVFAVLKRIERARSAIGRCVERKLQLGPLG